MGYLDGPVILPRPVRTETGLQAWQLALEECRVVVRLRYLHLVIRFVVVV